MLFCGTRLSLEACWAGAQHAAEGGQLWRAAHKLQFPIEEHGQARMSCTTEETKVHAVGPDVGMTAVRESAAQARIMDLPASECVLDADKAEISSVVDEAVRPDVSLWGLVVKSFDFLQFVKANAPLEGGGEDMALVIAVETFKKMLFTDPDPCERETNARDLAHEVLRKFYGHPGRPAPGEDVDEDAEEHARLVSLCFNAGEELREKLQTETDPAVHADIRGKMLQAVWDQVIRIDECGMKHISELDIRGCYARMSDDARLAAWDYLVSMRSMAMVHYLMRHMPRGLSGVISDVFGEITTPSTDEVTIREKIANSARLVVNRDLDLAGAVEAVIMGDAMTMDFMASASSLVAKVMEVLDDFKRRGIAIKSYIPVVTGCGGVASD